MQTAALLAVLGLVTPAQEESSPPVRRPSVLLIVADDLGYGDVGCFGGDVPTPHIDSIAAEGARLTDWYVASPVCTPSRYSLLTGRYPQRAQGGLDRVLMTFDAAHDARGLTAEEETLAARLKRAGYATALIGKWHLGHGEARHWPTRHGFQSFYGAIGGCTDYYTHRYAHVPLWYRDEEPLAETGYSTDLLSAEAERFLRSRGGDEPFFLLLSYLAPHYGKSIAGEVEGEEHTLITSPFGAARTDPRTGRSIQPVNTLQVLPSDLAAFAHVADEKRRYYCAMVKALDDGVGRVLAALEEAGLERDTLVLFTADNGADRTASSAGSSGLLRGGKHSLWEGGIRVPAALRWPTRVPPGTVLGQPASTLDLFPTLCALAGVAVDDLPLDGIDLGPALLGGEEIERDLYWRHGSKRALRRGRWKLLGGELYDLAEDPGEERDLSAAHPERVAELAAARDAVGESLAR